MGLTSVNLQNGIECFDKIRVGLNEDHITGFIEWINTNIKKNINQTLRSITRRIKRRSTKSFA